MTAFFSPEVSSRADRGPAELLGGFLRRRAAPGADHQQPADACHCRR